MDELKDKRTVSRLWRLGAFGNKLRTWDSFAKIHHDERYRLLFGLRAYVPGGPFYGNLPFQKMLELFNPETHYICEAAPDEFRIVQGELMRDVGGLYFRHSFKRMPLRNALLETDGSVKTMTGYAVDVYLRSICTPLSWIEIQDNLEMHEDAVVELTVFKKCVGDRVGCNTIVWESRLF